LSFRLPLDCGLLKLITFRDFLAHNYELIALRFVWAAVEDLSTLHAAVTAMLVNLDDEPKHDEE
jgi:uncharacterized protein with HEPN domain